MVETCEIQEQLAQASDALRGVGHLIRRLEHPQDYTSVELAEATKAVELALAGCIEIVDRASALLDEKALVDR